MEDDSEPVQLAYAQALADYADAGGYDAEVTFDVCVTAAIGIPYDRASGARWYMLSGGKQKRLALEALFRGPDEAAAGRAGQLLGRAASAMAGGAARRTQKSVLLVSHDRELLAQAATRIAALELGAAGNTVWVHGGGYDLRRGAPGAGRATRPVAPALDQEHEKLRQLRPRTRTRPRSTPDGVATTAPRRPGWPSSRRPGPPQESRSNST